MNVQRNWSNLDVPRKVKLTIADFLCLNDAGAFDEYGKTELIDGEIIAVNAQYTAHARYFSGLYRLIADAVDAILLGHLTYISVSVAFPPKNLPEPDIAVTSFREVGNFAVPAETITLLVEVSNTTLRFDLGKKAKIYAAAGVPEYWVADLEGGKMHQHWNPSSKGYTDIREIPFGQRIESITIAGLGVETAGI